VSVLNFQVVVFRAPEIGGGAATKSNNHSFGS
jgi:hypothetical protein